MGQPQAKPVGSSHSPERAGKPNIQEYSRHHHHQDAELEVRYMTGNSTSKTPTPLQLDNMGPCQPSKDHPRNKIREISADWRAMRTVILIAAGLLALATACSSTFNGTPTPRPNYTPYQQGISLHNSDSTRVPTQTIMDTTLIPPNETQAIQDPAQRHLELKQLMLSLTNQHRAAAGVPPVKMGQNPAAQIHAEESLKGCYTAHWDRWGLKPNHRYTMTGGTGADAENGSGSSYCIKSSDNYRPNGPMETEVAETVQGWMDSPGHRRSLLDPTHTVMNAGITYDRFNTNMVQHFSSDYIHYEVRPNISPDGILRMEGRISRATLEIGDSANVQIHQDPPLKPLTQGQLSNTYALCNPKQVGHIVEPLPPNWFHTGPEVEIETQEHPCVDPYKTNPKHPAPATPEEAHQAWADAKQASATAPPITVENRRIIAERFDISSGEFNFRANLSPILSENGPGIYTITLWGHPLHMGEATHLSKQSIFWQTEPPEDSPYRRDSTPTPTKAKQAKGLPTTPTSQAFQTTRPAPVNIFQEPTPVTIQASTPGPSMPVFLATTPTPAPPPTAIPTKIHAETVNQYSYSMELPTGWITTQESDGHTSFLSPRGTAGAAIHVWRINSDDAADLFKEHLDKLLKRMRTTAGTGESGIFEMKPPRPIPTAVTKHLWQARQMEYRWRESTDQCIRDAVDIISPSNWHTYGVLITAWTCEKDMDERAETERKKILTSFREKTVR